MPWKSDQQRKWGHTLNGIKALGGKNKINEWDNASIGMKLPEIVKAKAVKPAKFKNLSKYLSK